MVASFVNDDDKPFISIIVPVLHEADRINAFLTSLHEHVRGWSSEVVVVDGSPSQDTIDAIKDPSVICMATTAGRGRQMNIGVRHARGDVLLFLHADTRLPTQACSLIQEAVEDKRYAAGAFRLAIESDNPVLRLNGRLTTLRSRLTRLPFGDQAIFMRKRVFEQVGGYRDIPIMEDVDLMRRLRFAGFPIVILPTSVLTSSRRWEREGIILGTLRNWILRILFFLGVSPSLLAAWYH